MLAEGSFLQPPLRPQQAPAGREPWLLGQLMLDAVLIHLDHEPFLGWRHPSSQTTGPRVCLTPTSPWWALPEPPSPSALGPAGRQVPLCQALTMCPQTYVSLPWSFSISAFYASISLARSLVLTLLYFSVFFHRCLFYGSALHACNQQTYIEHLLFARYFPEAGDAAGSQTRSLCAPDRQ